MCSYLKKVIGGGGGGLKQVCPRWKIFESLISEGRFIRQPRIIGVLSKSNVLEVECCNMRTILL